MTDYPKPPFDTTEVTIYDTFDPELGAKTVEVDLNKLSNAELIQLAGFNSIALKILNFRLEQGIEDQPEEDQKG